MFKGVNAGLVVLVVALLLVINAGYGGGFSTLPALLPSRFGMDKISGIHKKNRPFILMETVSEMQNDCKIIRKLEEKIGKEKHIVMSYNTD